MWEAIISEAERLPAGLMHLMTGRPLTVGIVTGSPNILCHTERIEGFVSALKKHDPEAKIAGIVENHDDDIESYEQTLALLKSHPDINALFFSAAGVYGGCRGVEALGLSGKLRIIAFDKVPATRTLVEKGCHCRHHLPAARPSGLPSSGNPL